MQAKFEDCVQEFTKSEELSRIARRSSEDLKEEYCRIVFSVAAERRRNLLYIEATKQEFMKEIEVIKKSCEPVNDLIVEVSSYQEMQIKMGRDIFLSTESGIQELKHYLEDHIQ